MGKEVDYIATLPVNDMIGGTPKGNPLDSDLFYDDMGATMEFSNCCGTMSNVNGENKSNADWAAAVQAVGQGVGAVASRTRKDVKQVCPKKPLVRITKAQKIAGAAYDACVKKYNAGTLVGKQVQAKDGTTPNVIVNNTPPPAKKNNTTMYVIIGVGVLAVGIFAYMKMKKK